MLDSVGHIVSLKAHKSLGAPEYNSFFCFTELNGRVYLNMS